MPNDPAAWLHTLHKEHSVERAVTFSSTQPFGRQGVDFDPSFSVTTAPLYPADPQVEAKGIMDMAGVEAELKRLWDLMDGKDAELARFRAALDLIASHDEAHIKGSADEMQMIARITLAPEKAAG